MYSKATCEVAEIRVHELAKQLPPAPHRIVCRRHKACLYSPANNYC
jgi:hypothetical protein